MREISEARYHALSPLQKGMLYHEISGGGRPVDVIQILVGLREPLDVPRFREAWDRVIDRHPSLRASFHWHDGQPVQVVHEEVDLRLDAYDWRRFPDAETDRRFEALLRAHRSEGFDLADPPAMHLVLARIDDEEFRLAWTFHHIIADGRSVELILGEVFDVYEALARGDEPDLPPAPRYGRYVEWLEERDPGADREFWSERLEGVEAPTALPRSRPTSEQPGEEEGDGDGVGGRHVRERHLDEKVTARLREASREHDFALSTLLNAAWALLLSRHSGDEDVVFGTPRAGRAGAFEGARECVGTFLTILPRRLRVDPDARLPEWLQEIRSRLREARPHQWAPLAEMRRWSEVPPGEPLFETIVAYDRRSLDQKFGGGSSEGRTIETRESTAGYPLSLYAYGDPELLLKLVHDPARVSPRDADRLLEELATLLGQVAEDADRTVSELSPVPESDVDRLRRWNDTGTPFASDRCVHELFEEQVERTPEATAVACGEERATYRELDRRADRLARRLREAGVGPDTRVGVALDRSVELPASVLGVLKAGGAYVPLDPGYPEERLRYMAEDADLQAVLVRADGGHRIPTGAAHVLPVDGPDCRRADEATRAAAANAADGPSSNGGGVAADRRTAGAGDTSDRDAGPEDLAYVIYTSGSTGRPKGVMVEHRNVINFFTAMDDVVDHDGDSVWLAVTSLSFDISVLELLWTLCRGRTVVLYDRREIEARRPSSTAPAPSPEGRTNAAAPSRRGTRDVDLSLFYFASEDEPAEPTADADDRKYRLLLEGARFADRNGFEAVWTPERHFHAFGGLFPNPSLTGAAVAAVTDRVDVRAGSVVLPLHDPVRVAEEWAVVDNLSDGRAGIAFASGWQPDDFVLAPEGRYDDRKPWTFEEVETVRSLWRGESVTRSNPRGDEVELRTLPRPVQPELPTWVTTAGSPETFRKAGELGAHVLTHLLGQTAEELGEKIDAYREARRAHGHDPGDGRVTLMLHTFVGDDRERVRDTVRGPMKDYLRTATGLIRNFAREWFSARDDARDASKADGDGAAGDGGSSSGSRGIEDLTEEEMDSLLDFAFERYFRTSGLFGTPEDCLETLDRVRRAGVDEIGCLIDFGVEEDTVLEHLEPLARLRELAAGEDREIGDESSTASRAGADSTAVGRPSPDPDGAAFRLPGEIERHGVTHLQTTPSTARLLLADAETREALASLDQILLGGEVLPRELARALRRHTDAEIVNLYGPTETTVWSSGHVVGDGDGPVPIGRPLANTRFHVLDGRGRRLPIGAVGELYIGGAGVTRGYLRRADLTEEKFVADPFRDEPGAKLYRTGDLVRFRENGVVEFHGRVDRQVKIRGHRVEPGEIESALETAEGVRQAAVVARDDGDTGSRLVAHVVPADPDSPPAGDRLRRWLDGRLPYVMVPGRFVTVESMPLTPNGKIDRSALPAPAAGEARPGGGPSAGGAAARDEGPRCPPASDLEDTIADIWSDVLELQDVGVEKNFFDLGGHSLLAVRVHARLRESVDENLSVTDLFRFPTVRSLADHVKGNGDGDDLEESFERARNRKRARSGRSR